MYVFWNIEFVQIEIPCLLNEMMLAKYSYSPNLIIFVKTLTYINIKHAR